MPVQRRRCQDTTVLKELSAAGRAKHPPGLGAPTRVHDAQVGVSQVIRQPGGRIDRLPDQRAVDLRAGGWTDILARLEVDWQAA